MGDQEQNIRKQVEMARICEEHQYCCQDRCADIVDFLIRNSHSNEILEDFEKVVENYQGEERQRGEQRNAKE